MTTIKHKYNHIFQLICHIEKSISHNLDVKTVSGLGYVSHTQLYRDFYNVTGHSVKEYIKKRRLSNALALIKMSEKTITEIAYECGFSSQSVLCRAIKQTINMTPLEYKKSEVFYFFSPFNCRTTQNIVVSTETIPETCCVKYYHSSLLGIENNAINRFFELIPTYNGRLFGRNGKQSGTMFCYELYITEYEHIIEKLKSNVFVFTGIIVSNQAMYATSLVQNDEPKINTAWDYLYSEWLPSSMFEHTEHPYFEEYIIKNEAVNKLQLYLPIRKTNSLTEIKLERKPQLRFVTAQALGYQAERNASKTVIDFLSEQYPYVINSSNEFYVRKLSDGYVCGVRIDFDVRYTKNDNVEITTSDECEHLVLYSETMGDYDMFCDKLMTFANNNGIHIDRDSYFMVYDASNGFDRPKMRMYAPIIRI